MTVSSEIKRSDYVGNGSTVNFPTAFRFLQNEDIKVILTSDLGVEEVQAESSHYTLAGAGLDAGGTVTFLTAPPSQYTITIKRDIALTQGTDYVENDSFPAESHENALDKLTMLVQQLQEELDRTLKLTESQTASGLTVPLFEEGKLMQWTNTGDLKNVSVELLNAIVVSDFAKTYIELADAASTRTILDISYLNLPDVDSTSFVGHSGKSVSVNSSETGLEFIEPVAGAKGAGTNKIFWENDQNVTDSYTITAGQNAMSAGPVTVDSGIVVTVSTGSTWTIV